MYTNFSDFGLNSQLCEHLDSIGFTAPTFIQQQTITPVLCGQDLIACAQTGSGKTGSFLIPLIHILSESKIKARMPKIVILEPTRELALQILEQLQRLSPTPITSVLLVGGESTVAQEKLLQQSPDVLIATPGRLLDLCERQKVMLFGIKHIVIDEADRMLDMGFLPDVSKILEYIPICRQTLLFSATFDEEISHFSKKYMLAPKMISIESQGSTVDTIEQFAVDIKDTQKDIATIHLVKKVMENEGKSASVIIFCNRKTHVQDLYKTLQKQNLKVEQLHGDLNQSTRNQTIENFKNNSFQVLVASDIVARGLDVKDLSCVINYDVPSQTEDYVHRIGRTGRAGKSGAAYTLKTPKDKKRWALILKLIQRDIDTYEIPNSILTDQNSETNAPLNEPRQQKNKDKGNSKPFAKHPRHKNFDENSSLPVLGFGDDAPLFFTCEKYKKHLDHTSKQHDQSFEIQTDIQNQIPLSQTIGQRNSTSYETSFNENIDSPTHTNIENLNPSESKNS